MGQAEALLCVFVVACSGRTLVEGHDDVCADAALDVHHLLGRKGVSAAVDVALEGAAFFRQLADAGKRKHLEAAAIGQDWAVTSVEAVQSASLFQYLCARTQVKMIGVAKDDLSPNVLFEVADGDALHASHRADGHEDGRLYLTVVGRDESGAGIRLRVSML